MQRHNQPPGLAVYKWRPDTLLLDYYIHALQSRNH